jgi:hypothetical protein
MVAGLFAEAGLFCGEHLLRPTISNPRGYFESAHINRINNSLISQLVRWPRALEPVRRRIDLQLNFDVRSFPFASPWRLGRTHDEQLREEIVALMSRPAFCYKDPRLCVTLPTWLQCSQSRTRCLVVFREPSKTIQSYIKNGRDVYDPPLVPCRRELSVAYARNYERLMNWATSDWLFIHCNQILSDGGLERLSRWSGLPLEPQSLDSSLQRSDSLQRSQASRGAWAAYEKLCARAGYIRVPDRLH